MIQKKQTPSNPGIEIANVELKAGGAKPKILLVDDDAGPRSAAYYILKDRYDITQAVDGVDGLKKFREGKFDLVLTDNTMPFMNGTQMIAEIRKINPKQKIIMVTGDAFMTDEERTATGADKVIIKPYNIATLDNAVEEMIRLKN